MAKNNEVNTMEKARGRQQSKYLNQLHLPDKTKHHRKKFKNSISAKNNEKNLEGNTIPSTRQHRLNDPMIVAW